MICCEVDIGDGRAIGALSGGVSRHRLMVPAARASVPSLPELAAGLTWLAAQVTAHDEYGGLDLLDALGAAVHLPFLLSNSDGYDCSHLCASFVLHAGDAEWLGALADAPARASPNDLARCAGLLAG